MEVEVPGWLRPTVVIWHGPQPNDLEKIVMTAEATGEHDPPESHRERLLAIAAAQPEGHGLISARGPRVGSMRSER